MASYISSIRGIERTDAYVPVQAVSPYAYYPYRDGEPQQAQGNGKDWKRIYVQAANSAAAWVQTAKRAQYEIDQLTLRISSQLNTGKPLADSLNDLTNMLNHWESHYKQHADDLKPELWSSIELALRHPAAQELGLSRSTQGGKWTIDSIAMLPSDKVPADSSKDGERVRSRRSLITKDSQKGDDAFTAWPMPLLANETQRVQRLLLGADGLLNGLKHALAYAEQQRAVDLLQPKLAATLPYAAYYSSTQSYWPLPYVGLILNRYL